MYQPCVYVLQARLPVKLDFEVMDAVSKLERMGLLQIVVAADDSIMLQVRYGPKDAKTYEGDCSMYSRLCIPDAMRALLLLSSLKELQEHVVVACDRQLPRSP